MNTFTSAPVRRRMTRGQKVITTIIFALVILAVLGELIGMRVLPVLVPGLILGYLLPLFTAAWRGHRNCFAIGALNLLAGWTVVGWVVAMVWACTADVERS